MAFSGGRDGGKSGPRFRLTRRQTFPFFGAAAAAALAPATVTQAQGGPAELQATQSGTLAGSSGGSFAAYQITNPTGAALTLTLSFAPFNAAYAHTIGLNVYQGGKSVGGATGQSTGLHDATNSSNPTVSLTPSAGSPALVQIFNYSPTTISYTLTATAAALGAAGAPAPSAGKARYVYVGAYTPPAGKAQGISIFKMDPGSGALTLVSTVAGVQSPSFLAIDSKQRYLYAVNELDKGMVSAFAIDPANGGLTALNQQPSNGSAPAHLSVDPTGRYVLVANYTTGNWEVLPIGADGRLGAPTDLVQDAGSGPNLGRQMGPHAHMIQSDAAGKNVLGCDLGTDKVMVWQLDTAAGKLKPNATPSWQLDAGSGPRHLAFHPNGRYVYVIKELDSTITSFAYDPARGALQAIQAVTTLPNGFLGQSTCAEVMVHPSGAFLYGSNRGNDSIAIFGIDQASGLLTLVGHQSTLGKTPRNFNLDPSGAFLYAANQNSDTIVPFRVDPASGKLTPTGQTIQSPTPVCIVFGRAAS